MDKITIALLAFCIGVFGAVYLYARCKTKQFCKENNLDFKKFWRDILLLRNRVFENDNYKRLYEKEE